MRGSSVLAALVLVAIMGFAAFAFHGIAAPLSSGSQTAAAEAAAPAAPAKEPAKDKTKLEGDTRCNSPIQDKKEKKTASSETGVKNICVPGCVYKIFGGDVTNIKATDQCSSWPEGDQKKRCQTQSKCTVAQCTPTAKSEYCKVVPEGSGSQSPDQILGRAAQIPDYYKDDAVVKDLLAKAKTDDAIKVPAELSKQPTTIQEAFKLAKEDEEKAIEEKKTKATDRLEYLAQNGTFSGEEVDALKKQEAELQKQKENLAKVDELSKESVSLSPAEATDAYCASNPSDSRCAGRTPTACKTASCADTKAGTYDGTDNTFAGPCRDGSTVDPKTGMCGSYAGPCKDGTAVNPVTGQCGSYQGPCPSGQSVDPVTGKCSTGYQGPCPSGQSVNPATGMCGSAQTQRPPAQQAPAQQSSPQANSSTGNSGFGSAMQSLLSGFLKGFTAGNTSGTAQACSTDANTYAQQQQLYNQQLQQYNYQLQQYNQQSYYGTNYGLTAPTPPQPCTPSTGSQCSSQPSQPAASSCSAGTWKPTYSGSCITGWQCVPSSTTAAPTALLSCQPKTADVGTSVSVSYTCTNSVSSSALGFSTGGALSGSATTTVVAPASGTTNTLTLTCSNGSTTASDQCSIQVVQPSIILVANPKAVTAGEGTSIGWITSGMKSCVVSSPDLPDFTAKNASNTSVNGMATTSALTAPALIQLSCTTLGGATKSATTTVSVVGVDDSVRDGFFNAVSSTLDGKSTIVRGTTTKITWDTEGAPADARVSLWLFDERLGLTTVKIADDLAADGAYDWKLPKTGDACDDSANVVCASDLVPGRQYSIDAYLYRPAAKSEDIVYYGSAYTEDPFTISE